MLLIIYTALISYMFFFTLCIAPEINLTLDRKNSSKLLRKIFPKNFIFGLVLSFIALVISVIEQNKISFILSNILILSFVVNLKFLMPKINNEADLTINKKEYTKKFKYLHLLSVILYLIKMIVATAAIIFLLV